MTLVNITSTIHKTALSMPRDFASRATQTRRAMLSAMITTGIAIIINPQPPHAAQAAPSFWPGL
jgi:hypothetical protein